MRVIDSIYKNPNSSVNSYKRNLASVLHVSSFMKKVTVLAALALFLGSCKKDDSEGKDLKSYLVEEYAYVHEINGFYIVGSDETYKLNEGSVGASPKEIFEQEVTLFSSLLDQDEDGVVDDGLKAINEGLAKHFLFFSGHTKTEEELSEKQVVEENNLYVMAMKTDEWPFNRDFKGTGFSLSSLTSSTWRPDASCAVWEEVFHTITEAHAKVDADCGFQSGNFYRDKMEADISANTYDIEQQNQEENGQYDKVTATNEYIHQIWLIHHGGQSSALNSLQASVLQHMKDKGVPMKANPDYSKTLGTRLK